MATSGANSHSVTYRVIEGELILSSVGPFGPHFWLFRFDVCIDEEYLALIIPDVIEKLPSQANFDHKVDLGGIASSSNAPSRTC